MPAALFATLLLALWRGVPLLDDGGIVLRYMDNFAAGAFYAYNPADGPVFGISGFLHGVLAGGLAWTGLLSPMGSLLASNWLGLLLAILLTMRLLAFAGGGGAGRHAGWLLPATASPAFVVAAVQGLETPLHLAIVLLGILLLWRPYTAWIWAALALSIASKIDAVPVAAVLGLLALAKARSALPGTRPIPWHRLLREVLLAGVLPVIAWAGLCFALFGSPLPQTAYAKLHFHAHPEGFLPFLRPLGVLRWSLGGAGLLLAGLVALRVRQGRARALLHETSPAAASFAYLALYCAYNPGEQMVWYYVVPQFLLLLQAALAARLLAAEVPRPRLRQWLVAGALAAVAIPAWPVVTGTVDHMFRYQRICEAERIAVGRLVGLEAGPGDTLAVGLGHVAREAGLYTWDLSGLNSPAVNAIRAGGGDVLRSVGYQWHVGHGLLGPALQRDQNLRLVATGYDVSAAFAIPACRVFRRVAPESLMVARSIPADAVSTDGILTRLADSEQFHVEGHSVRMVGLRALGEPGILMTGVALDDRPLHVEVVTEDSAGSLLSRLRLSLPSSRPLPPAGSVSAALEVPLPDGTAATRFARVRADGDPESEPGELRLLEPVLLLKRERLPFAGVQFLEGWLPAEFWGRWAVGSRAERDVLVPAGATALRLRTAPFPGLPGGQRFRVEVDGRAVGDFILDGPAWVWRDVLVPLPPGPPRGVRVTFEFERRQVPSPADPFPRALPLTEVGTS